ncbi:MAG TPA: LysR family transcriptional regulator [Burkholderiaceae bacterium]|nr:LysR family transcriptional regulator [Burkholderiaceae bacterium]
MRDLDLTTLRLFVSVCETGNMRRASEQANMVPSAVSKRLAQLEYTVGAPLLRRKRHGVAPTPAGETLLQHARAMLMSARLIERDMAGHAAGLGGHVNVWATASVMAESLADHIAQFLKQPEHRNIQIDMEERISREVVRGIRDGVAAIGICWDAADTSQLHTRTYTHDRLCVAVPRNHPLAGRDVLRFEDTLDYEHVIMPIHSAVEVMLQREAGRLGKQLRHRVIVTNFEAAMRVVRAGLAIAVVPSEVTPLQTQAWNLKILPLQETWAQRRFVLCHRGEDTLTPAARLLLEALSAQVGPAG